METLTKTRYIVGVRPAGWQFDPRLSKNVNY
jgi:hypothetical protein